MTKNKSLLEKILRKNGYSVTGPRQRIFELLVGQPPQTMRALIERANGEIDRASFYRVIKLYEKLGLVRRITIGWKYKVELSDIFLEHHHHLSCISCGKVIAVKNSHTIEEAIVKLGTDNRFTLISHQLELQGRCETCTLSAVL
ncbi:MAG TPA: transcriptional repressor [Patescibacteria group bacterium]|jgi:Fur family ferric uptake transcriptional regulator|nr:transcriptional repressor [Patescibacteria group bacterium]